MKVYFILLISILLSLDVLAQNQYVSDSIHFDLQKRRQVSLAQQSIGLLQQYSLSSYGFADVSLQTEKGSLRRAQQAYSHTSATFYSEGIKALNRFKVAGNFLFDKHWEDSLANTMKGSENDLKPFYYFAGKHGKYERQNYRLNALLSYSIIENSLYIGMGANYQSHVTSRSVDPRPKVNEFQLMLKPEISVQLGKHQLSAGGIWGYGNEDNNIRYKNDNYKFSLMFPDRIYYTNQGYGYIVMKDSASLRRYDDYTGWKMSYQTHIKDWKIQAFAQQIVTNENNTHDIKFRKNYYLRSSYRQVDLNAEILLSENHPKHQQQLSFAALIQNGNDFNKAFNAHNYTAQNTNFHFIYSYKFKKSLQWQPEIGMQLNYNSSLKEDLAAAHYLKSKIVQPGIRIAAYHQMNSNDKLVIATQPSYRIPLKTDLIIPQTQENVFTKTIVYPDYYYFSSEIFQLNTEIEYISTHLLKNYSTGFSVNVNYMNQIRRNQENFDSQFIPYGNRLLFNFGIRIYL